MGIRQQSWALQVELDAKGYGELGVGIAGALMMVVFCPLSIVTVAAPYWTRSMVDDRTLVSKSSASLWRVTTITGIQESARESEMCGEETHFVAECDKIQILRWLTVVALLLSLASGLVLSVSFSHALKQDRRRMTAFGGNLAAVVLLTNLVSVFIAAALHVEGDYKLNGAAFASLILEIILVGITTGLVVCTLMWWSTSNTVKEMNSPAGSRKLGKSLSEGSTKRKAPTLLTDHADSKTVIEWLDLESPPGSTVATQHLWCRPAESAVATAQTVPDWNCIAKC